MPLREQVKTLMEKLDLTEEQALSVLEWDSKIDKGEPLGELSQDGKQVEREMKQTRSVDAYGKTRVRAQKQDQEKREIVSIIADALLGGLPIEDLEITNEERELTFRFQNRKFKIVLSAPRT